MAKTKETFDWIMPLVVILFLVFSWLFSFLGSKMKKRAQGEAQPAAKDNSKDLLEIILGKSQEPPAEQPTGQQDPYGIGRQLPRRERMGQYSPGQPVVTPKPIEPKWWGA
jgi:hypothetical protein